MWKTVFAGQSPSNGKRHVHICIRAATSENVPSSVCPAKIQIRAV